MNCTSQRKLDTECLPLQNRFNKSISRMRKWYIRGGVYRLLAFFIYRINRIVYACDIPPQTDFNNVIFMHKGFGIVVNQFCRIGDNTCIQHGVTLGTRISGIDAPIIGKNCFIGAKATIIGNVRIGDGAKIGAGAVVISSIPSGATAVGNPARIVKEG